MSIKLIISNYENDYNQMKYFKLNNGIIFRYYDIDVMIDEKYKPWLLEANKYPFMHLNDNINIINKIGFAANLLNLLGIVAYNHENGYLLNDDDKCNFKNDIEEMINNAFCEFNRPHGKLKRIFPLRKALINIKNSLIIQGLKICFFGKRLKSHNKKGKFIVIIILTCKLNIKLFIFLFIFFVFFEDIL